MRPSTCLFLLLTVSVATSAQQQKQVMTSSGGKVIMNLSPKPSSGCPVGLVAKRQGPGPAMWTIANEDTPAAWPGVRPRPMDGGVHVEVTAVERRLKQVDLSVAYVPYGVHLMPVQRPGAVANMVRKSFHLAADGTTPMHLEADLLLTAASGVARVYVTHVVYGDGSEWNSLSGTSCSVEPSGFQLISAAK